jgi:hypothetical protein
MKSSGPRPTGQKKALARALTVLKGTYEALCSSDEAMVGKLARHKLQATDELMGEDYSTSSDKATLFRAVSILYHGLAAFRDAESGLVVSIAAHEQEVVNALLREWRPRSGGSDLVELIDGEANSLDI